MPVKIFSRFFKPRKLSIFWKIILAINIMACSGLLLSYLATHISPASFTLIAFAGLAYPLFLYLVLLFIPIWLILRNKWFLLSFLTILIGFNHLRHFYQITWWSGPESETSTKIKVMSYNVRLFDLYNWTGNKVTRNKIFKVLERENPDIICFQEFYQRSGDNYFVTRDTMITFLKAKNVYEGFTHYIPKDEQRFGLATFTVYPIVSKKFIDFDNDPNNCGIITDLKIGKDTIRVINVHLASIRFQKADYDYVGDVKNGSQWKMKKDPEQKIMTRLKNAFVNRAYQSEMVAREIEKSPYEAILCGDFNDTPVSYAYRVLTQDLYDAFVESGNGIGNTYIGKFPSFRIDYILHSNGLHSYDFQTLPEKLSDHHAVTSMIEILEN